MPENRTDEATAAIRIYGKDGCPHTRRAREAMPGAVFLDVFADPLILEEMLRLSGGVRRIPVIVRAGGVEIGFKRGA
jgi:glutaredoxin 3